MATVSHASLTGSDLHEPKGAALAASGTVYVANGGGTGAWTSIGVFTDRVGEVQMFARVAPPTGWLELGGADISRTTYADLFDVVTIQQTGSRNNGSTSITGLSQTGFMQVGWFVGGSGIPNGTKIAAIPGSTSLTLDTACTSTGSSTVIVSPWALGDGATTFTLPSMSNDGRFPRSRGPSNVTGAYQTSQNLAHTHTGTSGTQSADHTHTGTTSSNGDHAHNLNGTVGALQAGADTLGGTSPVLTGTATTNTTGAHTHTMTTGGVSASHTHTFTSDSSGGSEVRPEAVSFLFCVKY